MGKEDRGSPVLIFPSNPCASTATAPPQRQRGRCCEDAGEKLPPQREFSPPVREEHTACNVIYFRPHWPLIHTESFAEWQKAGAGCTSRAFKHPGHDVTAPDVWPSILTDYTYDSELDNADGVPPSVSTQLDVPGGELSFERTYTFRMKSMESFIKETPGQLLAKDHSCCHDVISSGFVFNSCKWFRTSEQWDTV